MPTCPRRRGQAWEPYGLDRPLKGHISPGKNTKGVKSWITDSPPRLHTSITTRPGPLGEPVQRSRPVDELVALDSHALQHGDVEIAERG